MNRLGIFFATSPKTRNFSLKGLLHFIGPVITSLSLCACQSVTYDLRKLEQPVVFNKNPYLIGTKNNSVKLIDIDKYSAKVNKMSVTASNSYATTTSNKYHDPAQANAFAKIGGRTDLTIREVTLNVTAVAVNALLALGENTSIDANGKVTEIKNITTPKPPTESSPLQIKTQDSDQPDTGETLNKGSMPEEGGKP
jgi:hypothetical protein